MNGTRSGRAGARILLMATGAVAAVAVAGCSGIGHASPAPVTSSNTQAAQRSQNTGQSAGSGGATPADQAAPVADRSASSPTPECKAGSLRLSFGGSDAAMNQRYTVLRFTNKGNRSCVIVGFPGVSYVGGDDGRQIGAPAQRNGGIRPQITLAPGQVASTVIHSVNGGVLPDCQQADARGYRIYPPDDTASRYLPFPGGDLQVCANPSDPQLDVSSIKPGAGDPDTP